MSALTITPDFTEKTATIEGVVAAGEKVAVTLKDCAANLTSDLRLRLRFGDKTMAVFPLESTDSFTTSGSDLTCTMNLNTTQMLALMKRVPELDMWFILDDPGDSVKQMYFVEEHTVNGWPQEVGTDTPVDVNSYRTDISTLSASISALSTQLASEIQRVLNQVATKVTAVSGKGLSSIDLTQAVLNSLATKTELSAHTGNSTIHITAAERANWDAGLAQIGTKQDVIVQDGYIYVPSGIVAGVYQYHRLQIAYDSDMGWTMTLSDQVYIRSSNGTGFVEGT